MKSLDEREGPHLSMGKQFLISLESLWNDPDFFSLFLMPTCMFAICIVCFLVLNFFLYLRDVSFFKPCSLPTVKANPVFFYFSALKSIYKRSTADYPALCLLLTGICGVCQAYSRDRIFQFYLCFRPIVFFYKPETVEVLLGSTTIIDKAKEYNFLHPWLGTGLLTSTGSKWRYRRKLLTPSFHFSMLEEFVPIFDEQSRIMLSKLEKLRKEPWIDVVPLMTACTLDIICQTAMGIQLNAQGDCCNEYAKAIYEVGDIFLYRVLRPWLYLDVFFNISPSGRRFKRNLQLIHGFTRKVIKRKKAHIIEVNKLKKGVEPVSNGSPSQVKKRRAFLELLLEHHLKDPTFTEENIREEVDTFMFEGHDTTAMSLSWTLYLLGLHEDIQKEVHDELDAIFEHDSERMIERQDLTRMKYLECVIKEALRLYPSVPFIAREARECFKVSDYSIQKGSLCFIFPLMLHQDPVSFPEPQKFDPERFFPENSKGRHPYAYVPFSAGPRNCIGQKFALMEEKTVLANILRRFRVKSLDQRDKVNVTPNLIIRNVKPLRLHFEPREQN